MKILFCGLGSIGQRHAKNLYSLGYKNLYALRTRNWKLPEDLNRIRPVTDLNEALELAPDIVFITNPTSLHVEYATKFAQAGSHLFIEKPLSNSLKYVDKLQKLVEEKNLTVMVGYNFRFHPQLIKIKKLLENKVIGELISANVTAGEYLPNWHPKEDYQQGYSAQSDLGGGVILTQSHDLDYLNWLIGDVNEVFANADKKSDLEIDVEDTAQILLKFKSGVLGSLHLDYLQDPPARQMIIIGTKGKIFWDYYQNYFEVSQNGKVKKYKGAKTFERNEMYLDELKYFLFCIKKREKTKITIEDGKKIVKICLAAKQAAQTGQKIRLS